MVFQIGSICLVKCLLACNHLFDIVSLFWKRYSYISSFFRKAGKSPGFTHSLKAANNFLFYWIILSISWADFVAFKDLFLFKTKFFSTNWKEQKIFFTKLFNGNDVRMIFVFINDPAKWEIISSIKGVTGKIITGRNLKISDYVSKKYIQSSTILSPLVIISPFSTNVILLDPIVLSVRKGLIVFRNVLLSVMVLSFKSL